MTTKQELIAQFANEISKQFADEGKLIEAGFAAMRIVCIPDNAPPQQIVDMRMAYMAGAQHLFSSMVSIMDAGDEPTEADMQRMELIHNELEAFRKEIELWAERAHGSA